MRKTVDVENVNDKVIQIKYIGDKDWGKHEGEEREWPFLRERIYMVYLNVEIDVLSSFGDDTRKRAQEVVSDWLTGRE